jgi:cephalosporin-C deacetylase
VHGACVEDHWCATSVLLKIYPAVARRLIFQGGSFSGGMGPLLLPWDSRFQAGYLHVPSFGHHPLRVTLPCEGSGKAVREYWLKQPRVLEVLQYFDAAVAAQLIRIPMFVSCALFDPAVPPPGQFSVYNALPGPKQLCVFSGGHFAHPLEAAEYERCHQARDAFFAETVQTAS